ncbi:MAG: hypothetical protein JST51_03320 [Armatimonadetes bacterium]|nr:hypothetical protein [Armatimonadota bacterium]
MTKVINAAVVLFGMISIALGGMAYFAPTAGHKPHIMSLVGGTMLGALMIGSFFLWKSNPRAGRIMSLVLGVLSLGMFAPRAFSGVFYPNGLMAGLSLMLILLLGSGHMTGMKAKLEREDTQ